MQITTIKAKNAHQFASKIPSDLWYGEFSGKFNDDIVPSSDKELNQVSRGDLPQDDIQALIVLMIRYPDVPAPDFFFVVRGILDVPNETAFIYSANMGRVDILKWLKEQVPNELSAMIQQYSHYAFRTASLNGYLEILKWLKEQAPNELSAMIQAGSYYAFIGASLNGHLDTLKWLKEQAPNELSTMIQADSHRAFRMASENGQLDTLKWLQEQAPNELSTMIKADSYEAFRGASANGHLNTLKWLQEQAPNELSTMIRVFSYDAFCSASANGHLNTLKWLKEQVPNELSVMIQADSYEAFRRASENGHLDTLKWLKEQAANELPSMIQAGGYYAFRYASQNGHLDTLKWLQEQAPNILSAMIQAGCYHAFRLASLNGHLDTLKWLLQDLQCLAYAEQHAQEYGEQVVNSFIQDTLTTLHQDRELSLQGNPNAVFDIADAQKARSCFYILRNLIRRNDPALHDELLFLLDIPSVKALVHTPVTANEPNELLRLAISSGNQEAAALLLAIPAVRELAVANDFYRTESRGQLDLRALAQDRESSMRALTTGEQQRLAAAIGRYEPLIKKSGARPLLESLRDTLTARYEANPALISVDGREMILPTNWDAFQALKLTDEQREDALLAYEKNKDHTALRYLSRPNPWMAKNASYVYINENNRSERWSTFEEYTPEIVLFWLAAKDAEIPPTDGHTLEGRIDHFIDELAHIGRAHNWDRNRQNANGVREEYDDLEGDKPSCYSGVKRRLLQSVIGHPLLKLLTLEDVKSELRDFVRAHFIARITEENRALLKGTMEDYLYELEIELNEGTKQLKAWDISPEQQREFIAGLITKYGDQFKTEPRFETYIRESFTLEENPEKVSTYAHAFQFSGLIGLRELLESPRAGAVEVNRHEFFAPASSTTQRRAEQVDEEATLVNKKPKP